MNFSIGSPPDQAVFPHQQTSVPLFSVFRLLTGPDVGPFLSKKTTVIVPLGEVSVNWPAPAKLSDTLSCKNLFRAAVDMIAVDLLGLLSWNIIFYVAICSHCDRRRAVCMCCAVYVLRRYETRCASKSL